VSDNNNSYKQIFKATSIFGGVQVFNIVIAILRSKLIAILLGPAGMGIVSLFTTTIGLVTGISNFGLGTSAVKNVAAAEGSANKEQLAKTIAVFRKLVWITGGIGFLFTLTFAPLLSKLAFGNKSYTVAFMILSITLLFAQISAGQNVILQGMRKIQYMAKASMLGALLGLLISIPLYFFFKEKGIVPAIILTSISTLLLTWYFAGKVKIQKVVFDRSVFKTEGKEMLRMGFLISMSSIITLAASYVVRIYISKEGGIEEVGLFTAGFAIISTYVGLVFTAMSTDYYPRLSAMSNDNIKCKEAINQQAEIAILILAPILIIFLVFVQWGVIILYSKEFLGVVNMVLWAALGIFFKAITWSIGFVFLAKSDSKVFFFNELFANMYILLFNIIGYHYAGLTGLGISFLVAYFIYFVQVYLVSKRLYNFNISRGLINIFIIQFSIAITCFFVVIFFNKPMAYSLGVVFILVSTIYSWKEMDKRIGLKSILIGIKRKL
jgi:O-antigen/teichoic acid export membrane protein